MSNQTIDKVTILGSREGVWAAIRRLKTFTLRQLWKETNLGKETVRAYVKGLTNAGYLQKDGNKAGCEPIFKANVYTLMKNQKEMPRVREDGTPVTQGNARAQMWKAMNVLRHKRPFNAREIAIAASLEDSPVKESDARNYLGFLHKAGYLTVINQAGSQNHLMVYRFRASMYTGPKAPMVQRVKRVWDPNLKQVMWVDPSTSSGQAQGQEADPGRAPQGGKHGQR